MDESKTQRTRQVFRGDIYMAELPPSDTCEQSGIRPFLVIQNDTGNIYSPTVIGVPLTSQQKKKNMPTHVFVSHESGIKKNSIALCEQILTVDKKRLRKKRVGRISDSNMQQVENALMLSLAIKSKKHELRDTFTIESITTINVLQRIEEHKKKQTEAPLVIKKAHLSLIGAGQVLKNITFENCFFDLLDLREAKVQNITLRHCLIANADFNTAKINNLNIIGGYIDHPAFVQCEMINSQMKDATMQSAAYVYCRCANSNMEQLVMDHPVFVHAKMEGINTKNLSIRNPITVHSKVEFIEDTY